MCDSSEDFEVQAAALLRPPIDEDRSNIWTFTLFFCAISKERRSMKGYLKERMTYKRILEKRWHLLADNRELCDHVTRLGVVQPPVKMNFYASI